MKKRLIAIIAAAAMMVAAVPSVGAVDQWSYSEDLTVYVNGDKIDNGQYKPIIVNDRTMVRLVPIFEALGFKNYSYDDATKTVVFESPVSNVGYRFTAESPEAEVLSSEHDDNDQNIVNNTYPLDVPATLQYDDVFYMPIRAFCEVVKFPVLIISWDDATRSVYITGKAEIPADNENTTPSAARISIGSYRAYTNGNPRDGIANLDITSSDSDSVMFTYTDRNQKDYNMGNVTAYLQDNGTYVAEGENRRYILTPSDKNILLTIIEGNKTVVDNRLFEKL